MYDFDKESDKDFLREAGKMLQEQLLEAKRLLILAEFEKLKDEEIKQKLKEELLNLRERVFNSKQERKTNPSKNKKRKKGKLPHNKNKNKKLKDQEIDLEDKVIEYKLDDNCCPKCGSSKLKEMSKCSEESSEIEVIERKYILKRHKRQKYSCKSCNNVITAPGGVKLTPGGEYSIQLATQVAGDKYEDHIPLERQRKQMKRAGLNVEVKTLFGITEHLYNRIYSLNEMIRRDVLEEKWVHIDESPIDFYNPNKSKGYIWSMSNPRGAYYQFEPTRSGKIAQEMLKGYHSGNVVTDGFSGYNFLDKEDNISHAFCWAHVRRKFFEAMKHDPQAEKIVDLIDKLYEIEHQADSIDDLTNLRSTESASIVKDFDDWIDSMEGHYLKSSSIGKAISYYQERKKGLHLFLYDKNVPIGRVEKWRGDVQVFVNFRKRKVPLLDPFPLSSHQTGRADFPHPAFNQSDTTSRFASQLDSQASYIGQVLHKDTCLDIGGTQYLAACAS